MEWSFIAAAVRRRIRFVVLCALVGALPGLLTIARSVNTYEATAVLSIATPSGGAAASILASQPDRYIQSQISIIGSTENLTAAAKELGEDFDAALVGEGLSIEQEPETDIVRVTVKSGVPKNAAAIANAVAEAYLRGGAPVEPEVPALAEGEVAPATTVAPESLTPTQRELAALDEQIESVTALVREQTAAIEAAMKPYIDANQADPTRMIPQPEVVAPAQSRMLATYTAQLTQLQAQRSAVESTERTSVRSTLIERAVEPDAPSAGIGRLLVVAGVVLGGLGGVAVALVLAQLSSKVLDETIVAATLGSAVVGTYPRSRALLDKPTAALMTTPPEAAETLERISVRAEAMADPDIDHALTIAVVGTRPGAGTTTLTLALARRFAQSGYSVVVVDGDLRTQTITESFGAGDAGGIGAVLAAETRRPSKPVEFFTETGLDRVEVLGAGRIDRRTALRRDALGPILDAARDRGQIVLYDGGSLMGTALTLFAAKAADVIVLAVPLHEQDHDSLAEVAEHLPADRSRVLAVTTAPLRRRRRPEATVPGTGRVGAPEEATTILRRERDDESTDRAETARGRDDDTGSDRSSGSVRSGSNRSGSDRSSGSDRPAPKRSGRRSASSTQRSPLRSDARNGGRTDDESSDAKEPDDEPVTPATKS